MFWSFASVYSSAGKNLAGKGFGGDDDVQLAKTGKTLIYTCLWLPLFTLRLTSRVHILSCNHSVSCAHTCSHMPHSCASCYSIMNNLRCMQLKIISLFKWNKLLCRFDLTVGGLGGRYAMESVEPLTQDVSNEINFQPSTKSQLRLPVVLRCPHDGYPCGPICMINSSRGVEVAARRKTIYDSPRPRKSTGNSGAAKATFKLFTHPHLSLHNFRLG